MLSSRKFFKNAEVVEEKNIKKIETTHIPKKKKQEISHENQDLSVSDLKQIEHDFYQSQKRKQEMFDQSLQKTRDDYLLMIKKEKQKFFHELLRLKEEVLQKSLEEGEQIKQEAYLAGVKEGQLDGFESGKESGFDAGLKEAESLKQNALSIIEQTNEAMNAYQKEKQEDFIKASALMAENIINQELSLSEDKLKLLLQPVLNKVEKADNFITIFVTKDNLENTNLYMEKMKEQFAGLKFAVLVDEALETNGCVIETNYEVIDLQIKKQLDAMVKDLMKENDDD
ncbi:FliH/SctL family protein [Vagococcus carniphilus]|uniref:FliH/SctL family protein n=1 Tax=Vagococcus carniphilus TaxID=218144 RepID=A0AAW8U6B3_9ENTE|nr:FliH/SctL family protein [Vagococcus carniphilus]MDT2829613.1 FliH/SctL family protein [Vagococcus carniphilus]MDT2833685.1 FliH/SctL family protein [Vagococcus carniphilus]MDT2839072.1 FliH/SctL family protein [Vagococcus carniphilus]MDT2847638.1 FliH/SctL family protein [Vagococcus carniphilus]MDT2853130.1 FliH/SctL family protein [Vagococcus carniphilus]